MTAGPFIDIPVTRRCSTSRIGILRIDGARRWIENDGPGLIIGELFAIRAPHGGWRTGVAIATPDLDLSAITAACDGDIVYRVEDR